MKHVYDQVAQVARAATTVLLRGESGTGKELIAHALHRVAPLEKFDVIVVDAGAPAEAVQRLRDRRHNVEIAG